MHLLRKRELLLAVTSVWLLCLAGVVSSAPPGPDPIGASPPALLTTTGPTPPPEVLEYDAKHPQPSAVAGEVLLSSVPNYHWRHGCGPTAVGMILGYYDGLGYDDLIEGTATTQTAAVNQAIASGGDAQAPLPAGERHFEDYARPLDESPTLIIDDVITTGRTPHVDDSVADFMRTSRSSYSLYYGWSWSNFMIPAWRDYISLRNPNYLPSGADYFLIGSSQPLLTWTMVTSEIDAGRPMLFLVDSNGDGLSDHAVTAIGYRDAPAQQYAAWDTWYSAVRWADFGPMEAGKPWGIAMGLSFALSCNTPAAVSGLGGSVVDTTTLELAWEAAPGVEQYEVWSSTGATTFDIGDRSCANPSPYRCTATEEPSLDVADLGDPAVHHTYRVRSEVDCGSFSALSTPIAEFEFSMIIPAAEMTSPQVERAG